MTSYPNRDPFTVYKFWTDVGGIVNTSAHTIKITIKPGIGYWVKVNQNGKLLLISYTDGILNNKIKIMPTSELPPPPPKEEAFTKVIPQTYSLEQNIPNPFNPVTKIKYQLPEDSKVTLRIYNTLGQLVATLVDAMEPAGYKSAEWNASVLASGVYFYRLEAVSTTNTSKSFTQVKKMIFLR